MAALSIRFYQMHRLFHLPYVPVLVKHLLAVVKWVSISYSINHVISLYFLTITFFLSGYPSQKESVPKTIPSVLKPIPESNKQVKSLRGKLNFILFKFPEYVY